LGVFDQPSWLAALLAVPILAASHLLALGYARVSRRAAEAGPGGREG
jgi:hypothetical protein